MTSNPGGTMQISFAGERGAALRFALVATAMAVVSLLVLPGTASAATEYTTHTQSFLYTCGPGSEPGYECDKRGFGAEAWIAAHDGGNTYPAAKVEFHPRGEQLYVHDNYTNGRYAWAQLRVDHADGGSESHFFRSAYYTHVDLDDWPEGDWPEGQPVSIRACEGTYSDPDAYGCSEWAHGTV